VRFIILSWRRKYFKNSEYLLIMTSTTIDARRKKSRQEDFDNSVEVANVLANVAAVAVADAVVRRQN
jgi:hypothetical protein